ncbi:MAG TPA: asparagine synthase (glutamine-hydrolyzing) [Bacilli bacterium]
MCGIAGIVTYDKSEPSSEQLKRMTDAIAHRGPDDSGFFRESGVGLGFRRLSIIDLAGGQQPMTNEDSTLWLVFNGEIYNFPELRRALTEKGHRFKTQCDSEVVLHSYEEFGTDCVKRFRGMFAFAIWDCGKRLLFAARDHFGIKPFYYASGNNGFLFASEIKSILASGEMERKVDWQSLYHYMTFQYVPDPRTMFAGIKKLPPAHTLIATEEGRVSLSRYWNPVFAPKRQSFHDAVEQIRASLQDSVKHHLVSDVRRGCFLSSGVDSTAIAAMMRQMEPIKTFSVGFAGPNNETVVAKETARALGTEHYVNVITAADYFASVPKAVWLQDEPVADPAAIALYHVARLAKEHVTVVLSGEGADELFGGYRIYREPLALKPLNWLPLAAKRFLHLLVSAIPGNFYGKNYLLRGTTPLQERFFGNANIFPDMLKQRLLRQTCLRGKQLVPAGRAVQELYRQCRHLDPVSQMQYIDLHLWLPGDILMKADKMTMAHSLELRVPFLDKELFAVAASIPASYRIAGGTTKYVFRKAMEGIIPDFILHRPKLGFPVPMRDWLKGERGRQLLDVICESGVTEYFNLAEVWRLFALHRDGKADFSRHLWVLYVFALWHMTYMEGTATPVLAPTIS